MIVLENASDELLLQDRLYFDSTWSSKAAGQGVQHAVWLREGMPHLVPSAEVLRSAWEMLWEVVLTK